MGRDGVRYGRVETLVRPMDERDAAEVTPLCAQLGYPAMEARIAARILRLLQHPDHRMFVAQVAAGRVAGWIHVQTTQWLVTEPFALVCGLVVDEQYRGRRIGRALMERAEEWARRRGCREMLLYTNIRRISAHLFYRGLGYTSDKTSHAFRKLL